MIQLNHYFWHTNAHAHKYTSSVQVTSVWTLAARPWLREGVGEGEGNVKRERAWRSVWQRERERRAVIERDRQEDATDSIPLSHTLCLLCVCRWVDYEGQSSKVIAQNPTIHITVLLLSFSWRFATSSLFSPLLILRLAPVSPLYSCTFLRSAWLLHSLLSMSLTNFLSPLLLFPLLSFSCLFSLVKFIKTLSTIYTVDNNQITAVIWMLAVEGIELNTQCQQFCSCCC